MKRPIFLIGIAFFAFAAKAQRSTYDTIRVGMDFTDHVVFESKIVDYTLGSGQLQGVDGTYSEVGLIQAGDNILKLAANIEHFETTNLFVETSTGYFNFILAYADIPEKQIWPVRDQDATLKKSELVSGNKLSSDKRGTVGFNTYDAMKEKERAKGDSGEFYKSIERTSLRPSSIARKLQGIQYYVSGIFTNGSKIGFKLVIENEEDLRYTLSYVNWTIKEKKKFRSKKGSVEYNEPLHSLNESSSYPTLKKGEQGIYIFIFKKFTLSKSQELILEIGEKDGSRTCDLKINQNYIIKADYLSN